MCCTPIQALVTMLDQRSKSPELLRKEVDFAQIQHRSISTHIPSMKMVLHKLTCMYNLIKLTISINLSKHLEISEIVINLELQREVNSESTNSLTWAFQTRHKVPKQILIYQVYNLITKYMQLINDVSTLHNIQIQLKW